MRRNIKISSALFIILFGFSFATTFAQISDGGQPYSFSNPLELPTTLHPNPSELQNAKQDISKDCNAMEFARFLSLNISLEDKAWQKTSTNNGSMIYRLAISSPGALAIGAYFSDMHIPNGAKLFIYSPDHKQLIGAFTSFNNSSSGLFATEYILGDKMIIEYAEPAAVKGEGHFVISEILHAYRGINTVDDDKGFGGSGTCEVNVNCPEGSGKTQQRDAVVRLLIKTGSSGVWCTGSLINNTSEDRTPYIITADHCGINSSADDHEQWVFYFHYQSPDCEDPIAEPEHQTMVGCTEIASSSNAGILGSDFYLVLLSQEVPIEYRPFFIGWNRDDLGSDNGYTIHHPQGDIKKISTYTSPLTSDTYTGGMSNGFWKVVWAETETNHGVTEGGSSGSPIFDSEGYLIGTLTGGGASCTSLTAPDYYGKFSKHWDSNGSSNDEQLMPWLDPLNSDIEKMSGIYLGINEEEVVSNHLFTALPNPVDNQLTLYFNNNYNTYQVQISDLSGKTIDSFIIGGNESKRISVSHLQKGIYFVRVNSDDLVQTLKVVKL